MEYVNKFVIGQNDAKMILSVAVYDHYMRIIHNAKQSMNDSTPAAGFFFYLQHMVLNSL